MKLAVKYVRGSKPNWTLLYDLTFDYPVLYFVIEDLKGIVENDVIHHSYAEIRTSLHDCACEYLTKHCECISRKDEPKFQLYFDSIYQYFIDWAWDLTHGGHRRFSLSKR